MSNINKLVKNTLESLRNKKLSATPDNYYEEFSIQANILNQDIEECKTFTKIIHQLTDEEQINIKKNNITTFSKLALFLIKYSENLKALAFVLSEILRPSLQFDLLQEIDDFTSTIVKNPKELLSRKTISEIKRISSKRINNDREILLRKSEDFKKITSLMSSYFNKILFESQDSSRDLLSIKDELENLNISNSSNREIENIKSRLIDTLYSIENNISKNESSAILQKSDSFGRLAG